jgi:hypothetical protein
LVGHVPPIDAVPRLIAAALIACLGAVVSPAFSCWLVAQMKPSGPRQRVYTKYPDEQHYKQVHVTLPGEKDASGRIIGVLLTTG